MGAGVGSSGVRSEPKIKAGQRGKPQSLESGGPEQEGPSGMSPSRSLKPGNEGAGARGKSTKRESKGQGKRVIHSFV